MNNGLLFPPNIHQLSNSVIGAVVTRRPPPPPSCYAANKTSGERDYISTEPNSSWRKTNYGKQPPSVDDGSRAQSLPARDRPHGQQRDELWNNLSTAERVLLLQRRRRRLTQRRYRKKIEGKAALLAKQIDALQEEVQELQKKAKVVASTPNREPKTPWNLLVEYFSLFRRGLDTQALSDDHVQKNFLQTVMTSDVASNHGFGVEVMLEDWRSLSQRHPNLEIVLVKLCNRSEHVIIADVKGYTTITESMLRSALSNSHASDTEETWPPFASRLLGQRLVIPGSVLFEWGETESRFASVLYEVDMLSALVARLGDVEEASVVMDSALSIAG